MPHLLTVGTRLIIDDVDDDGDLAVNLLSNPWDENAWIMKENFDCIKIAEKQAFITRVINFTSMIYHTMNAKTLKIVHLWKFLKP